VTYLQPETCYRAGCSELPARRYINEWLCPTHEPERVEPDLSRTLDALVAAGGRQDHLGPFAVKGGSDIVKSRPGGYVSRQRAERIAAGTTERQHR
jgi:hypothetical protein